MPKNIHQAHDKLYKRCMSDINVAKEVIQQHLPAILLKNIDFASLKQEPTEFINEKFKLKQADLIYSASFKEQEDNKAYFYFLCEHQSKSEFFMAFIMLIFIVEIMKNHMEKHHDGPLPLVTRYILQ